MDEVFCFAPKTIKHLKAADKNNDGYISKQEFQKFAKNLSKEQVEKVV